MLNLKRYLNHYILVQRDTCRPANYHKFEILVNYLMARQKKLCKIEKASSLRGDDKERDFKPSRKK
jgi:hypothetical protein